MASNIIENSPLTVKTSWHNTECPKELFESMLPNWEIKRVKIPKDFYNCPELTFGQKVPVSLTIDQLQYITEILAYVRGKQLQDVYSYFERVFWHNLAYRHFEQLTQFNTDCLIDDVLEYAEDKTIQEFNLLHVVLW